MVTLPTLLAGLVVGYLSTIAGDKRQPVVQRALAAGLAMAVTVSVLRSVLS